MLQRILFAVAITLALSIAAGLWRAFWASGAGVRTSGGLQRLRRQLLGAPKPQPVELGPDGRWRPFVSAREKRSERIAAWAWIALAAIILGSSYFAGALFGH